MWGKRAKTPRTKGSRNQETKSPRVRYEQHLDQERSYAGENQNLEQKSRPDHEHQTSEKGVLHWVAQSSPGVDPLKVEVRLFDRLLLSENPAELDNWLSDLNPHSKVVIPNAFGVSSLRGAKVGDSFRFERLGYFVVDQHSTSEKLVFNRTVTLEDSYSKGGK